MTKTSASSRFSLFFLVRTNQPDQRLNHSSSLFFFPRLPCIPWAHFPLLFTSPSSTALFSAPQCLRARTSLFFFLPCHSAYSVGPFSSSLPHLPWPLFSASQRLSAITPLLFPLFLFSQPQPTSPDTPCSMDNDPPRAQNHHQNPGDSRSAFVSSWNYK